MSFEVIEFEGKRYAEIIWADTRVDKSTFFSPPGSSFQFGLLAHKAGSVEAPHTHHTVKREIADSQQMFVVQRGVVAVLFYTDDGRFIREVVLRTGDAILILQGVHALRTIEDMQCLSIKQGPFLGMELDKIPVEVKP